MVGGRRSDPRRGAEWRLADHAVYVRLWPLRGHRSMSALRWLLGAQRTCGRDRRTDANDPQETLSLCPRTDAPLVLPEIDFATSRAHSMKRSTTGLSVRFDSVTMLKGNG